MTEYDWGKNITFQLLFHDRKTKIWSELLFENKSMKSNLIFQFLFNNLTCETKIYLIGNIIWKKIQFHISAFIRQSYLWNGTYSLFSIAFLSHPWPSPFMFRLNEFDLMILKRPYSTIEIVFVIIICWSQGWTELSVPRKMCLISSQFPIPFRTNSKLSKVTTPVSSCSRRDISIFKIWT